MVVKGHVLPKGIGVDVMLAVLKLPVPVVMQVGSNNSKKVLNASVGPASINNELLINTSALAVLVPLPVIRKFL